MKRKANILVIDVGGHHIKVADSAHLEHVKIQSGPQMSPGKMVADVKAAIAGWDYTAISIGYPGIVTKAGIAAEPHNLAPGWVGFDFAEAFDCRVRVVNDAAMQAVGSYEGGSMLFLGIGTGLGAAMILEGVLAPMELAHLPYRKGRTYEEYVGQAALDRMGKQKWQKHVLKVVEMLRTALEADYVILGGGNTQFLDSALPEGVRLGSNANAFIGGQRLWAHLDESEVTAKPGARKGR